MKKKRNIKPQNILIKDVDLNQNHVIEFIDYIKNEYIANETITHDTNFYLLSEVIKSFKVSKKYDFNSIAFAQKIENFFSSELENGFLFEGLIIQKIKDDYYIHVMDNKYNKISAEIFNSKHAKTSVWFYIGLLIFALIMPFVVLLSDYFLEIKPQYIFFTIFSVILLRLFFLFGFNIIVLTSSIYVLIKSTVITLNENNLFFYPYSVFFDFNIFNISMVIITFSLWAVFKTNLNFSIIVIFGIYKTILFSYKYKPEEYASKLINLYNFYEKINEKQLNISNKLMNFMKTIDIDINPSLIIKSFKFMFFIIMIAIGQILYLFKYDYNNYYFTKNANYCKNIHEDELISKYTKNDSIVFLASQNFASRYKIDYNYAVKQEPVSYFDNSYFGRFYIYEVKCDRNILEIYRR